tara:strand:+ start:17549 stop:18424 length:876 start_codon:yes stop_codon:yes gene_type:complete
MVISFDAPAAVAQEAARDLREIVAEAAAANANLGADGVVRIGWQRADVPVTVDGMRLKPAAGLGSWAAFKSVGAGALVMGDTVVFEDEITPAMDAAIEAGLSVTALHNHFIFDDPPVYFMHIGGHGEPAQLAAGVKAVWDAIKALRAETPSPRRGVTEAAPDTGGDINPTPLEEILGAEPSVNDGVIKFTFARQGRMHGVEIGGSMGLTTWAAFSGSDALAAVDGDFIMTEDEVQPVLRALRRHGIHIVALHNHMVGGDPTYYFLHFWGVGPASSLAAGIGAARQTQASVK